MTETAQSSDLPTGFSLVFGVIAVLAAVAMAVTAYLSSTGDGHGSMQLYSGVALTVAILGGLLAIAAIHVLD
jgi:hypothetical protein